MKNERVVGQKRSQTLVGIVVVIVQNIKTIGKIKLNCSSINHLACSKLKNPSALSSSGTLYPDTARWAIATPFLLASHITLQKMQF